LTEAQQYPIPGAASGSFNGLHPKSKVLIEISASSQVILKTGMILQGLIHLPSEFRGAEKALKNPMKRTIRKQ
jgi:hypothetical protein